MGLDLAICNEMILVEMFEPAGLFLLKLLEEVCSGLVGCKESSHGGCGGGSDSNH